MHRRVSARQSNRPGRSTSPRRRAISGRSARGCVRGSCSSSACCIAPVKSAWSLPHRWANSSRRPSYCPPWWGTGRCPGRCRRRSGYRAPPRGRPSSAACSPWPPAARTRSVASRRGAIVGRLILPAGGEHVLALDLLGRGSVDAGRAGHPGAGTEAAVGLQARAPVVPCVGNRHRRVRARNGRVENEGTDVDDRRAIRSKGGRRRT